MEFKDLSEKEQKLVVDCKYDLLRDKCIILKDKGVDACVGDSAYDLVGVTITNDARDLIDLAVPQIINYQGLSSSRPLEGLTIGGFYYFMSLFYFTRIRQLASHFDTYIIDKMLMKNTETGDEIWLMHKVDSLPYEEIERFMDK